MEREEVIAAYRELLGRDPVEADVHAAGNTRVAGNGEDRSANTARDAPQTTR